MSDTSLPPVFRTPDERFADLLDWPFEPRWVEVHGLRMHVVDEGPTDGPVMLLLHGEPSWSYLYRHWIPVLVEAGYRCVAVDSVGFGRSDKVTDPSWYSLDRHVAQLVGVVEALDLTDITMVVQDWAGPVGLTAAVEVEDRITRLVVLNTWLHHDGHDYNDAVRNWHAMAATPDFPFGQIVGFESQRCSVDPIEVLDLAYGAPFPTPESMAGAVAWPAMLPFSGSTAGGPERQARTLATLQTWDRPIHVLFGDRDGIFTVAWGEQFAGLLPGATFETVAGGTHFVQEVGAPLARRILELVASE